MLIGFATLFASLVSCAAPAAPNLLSPTLNQINAPLTPTFSCTPVGSSSCPVHYEIRIGLNSNCQTNPQFTNGFDSSGTHYNLLSIFSLEGMTNYYWCVRAVDNSDSSLSSTSTLGHFKTRDSQIVSTANNLSISPATTANQPSGSSTAYLSGANAEEGSTVHVYLHLPNQDPEVASLLIDNNPTASFQIPIDVTLYNPDSGPRTYFVKISRPTSDGVLYGLPSSSLTHYFDVHASLPSPHILLGDSGAGSLKWQAVPGATSYKIWRRVGLENCSVSDFTDAARSRDEACFRTTKPFRWIRSVPSSSLSFQDPSLPSTVPPEGFSYFVTAHSSTSSSPRSNVLSFNDTRPPTRTSQQIFSFIPLNTGRDALAFFCGLDLGGFYGGDNTPDLKVNISYAERLSSGACPTDSSVFQTAAQNFDAFNSGSYSQNQYSEFNCILTASLTNLHPNSSYCYTACLEDPAGSGLSETSCSTVGGFNTPPDTVAPIFTGLDQIGALLSGTGVQVGWTLADEDVSNTDVVHYEIQKTDQIDSAGIPIFDPLAPVTIVSNGMNTAAIEGLKTATKYCFQAGVLDSASNRSIPPNRWLCATTIDNRPSTPTVIILPSTSASDEAFKVQLQFQVIDRFASDPNLQVSLSALEYRFPGAEWVDVKFQYLSDSNLSNLKTGLSVSNAPWNSITFNTLSYFAGEQDIEIRIKTKDTKAGYISDWGYSQKQTLFEGMTKLGAFDHQSLSACSLRPSETVTDCNWSIILLVFGSAFTAVFFLRKKSAAK